MRAKADDYVRVLLADDHALFREGLAEILAAEDDMRLVGEAETGSEAVALAEKAKPNVVLLDVEMPGLRTERVITQIMRASPSMKVLILTMYDEPRLVRKCLALGACGYIVKNATRSELIGAIRAVHQVRHHIVLSLSRSTAERLEQDKNEISARELEVLLLAVRAMSNGKIASHLHISEGTVKRHLTNVFAKLGASSRADAAKKSLARGLITFRDLVEPDE